MTIGQKLRHLVLGFVLMLAGGAMAASVPLITGPIDPGALLGTLNTLVQSINANVAGIGNNELTFTNAAAFSPNSNVATSVTSVGPAGAHTTVQEWLVVVNPSGTVRWIPAF